MHTSAATLLVSKQAVENIRQAQSELVSGLLKNGGQTPRLAIVQIKDDPVINTYVNSKKNYGSTIGVLVDIHKISQSEALNTIQKLNSEKTVHGIIVQLPIVDKTQTTEILDAVALQKDVDGLRKKSPFTPATPLAIMSLLEHYKVDFSGKKVVVVGRGELVGAPFMRMLETRGVLYENLNSTTTNNSERLREADIIVTATGYPGLIKSDDIKAGAVVVDAGTSTDSGKTVGDVEDAAYERSDITLTPKKGGVGPLTVCLLFGNVITAYKEQILGSDL